MTLKVLSVTVPPELIRLAREKTGEHHAPISHLVRAGLALLAGENVDDFTPSRARPRKTTATQTTGKETL